MPCLVVYYSFSGNNRILGDHLAARLNAPAAIIEPASARTGFSIFLDLLFNRRPRVLPLQADPSAFDHILFVGPIWNLHIAHPMQSAMASLKGRVKACSFATLCGAVRPGQIEVITKDLTSAIGLAPANVWLLPLTELTKAVKGPVREEDMIERVTPEHLVHFKPQIDAIIAALGSR